MRQAVDLKLRVGSDQVSTFTEHVVSLDVMIELGMVNDGLQACGALARGPCSASGRASGQR